MGCGHGSSRTSIVFDVCWAEAVDGSREYFGARELRRIFAAIGEPLRWGIPQGRIDETLARLGLRVEVAYEPADLLPRYLTRQDGSRWGDRLGSVSSSTRAQAWTLDEQDMPA